MHDITLPMAKHDLLFMVVYSPLAYRHQAFGIVVTIECITIMNKLSPVTFVLIQLFRDSSIITHT